MSSKEIAIAMSEHYSESLQHFENKNIVGLWLQGSQNYGLDLPGSDVDTKLIVVPTLEDIARNRKPVSTTHIRANEEHIDFKDVRLYIQLFRKQNLNFVEILFSDYWIINPIYMSSWAELVKNRDAIARMNPNRAIHSMAGIAEQKYVALEHHYPSKVEVLAKYGYDPKQLHHLRRIDKFTEDYIAGKTYLTCMRPEGEWKKHLLDIKAGVYSLQEARDLANESRDHIDRMVKEFDKSHPEEEDKTMVELLNEVQYEIIKTAIKEELKNG